MTTITAGPATLDFDIYRGDTLSVVVTVTDSNSAAVNLTGWSAKATIYNVSGTAIGNGWTLGTPASDGTIFMFLPDGTSELLATGFTYDLEVWKNMTIPELSSTRTVVVTVVRGGFTVRADISDGTGTGRGATT